MTPGMMCNPGSRRSRRRHRRNIADGGNPAVRHRDVAHPDPSWLTTVAPFQQQIIGGRRRDHPLMYRVDLRKSASRGKSISTFQTAMAASRRRSSSTGQCSRLSGGDRATFLQGLVTADISGLANGEACWAALLTPQGKILFDFLVVEQGDDTHRLCPRSAHRARKTVRLLQARAQVSIEPVAGMAVVALPPGARSMTPRQSFSLILGYPTWEAGHSFLAIMFRRSIPMRRIIGHGGSRWASPIRSRISDRERSFHEANLDQLGGVSFTKGCYVGQEVVSRMEHRGTARNRILPIAADRPLVKDSDITGRGRALGQVLSIEGTRALALIRLDRLAEALDGGDPIVAGDAAVAVLQPTWARFKVPGGAAA